MQRTSRATVVAPHPDDEVFGVGGLMSTLVERGYRVRLVAVTDGEAAFGQLATDERAALVARRSEERLASLEALGLAEHTEIIRLGIPDGRVAAHEPDLAARLADLAGPVMFASWRYDGHPDHEAVGRAAAVAASAGGATLYEYPVWAEHRGRLSHLGRVRQRRFRLSPQLREAKVLAVRAHRSQLEPGPDGRPVVPPEIVDALYTADEVVFG
ncbi:MAG: PIG-L family deacetylase [Acidimicrobiia bacterium]|jgi:LmbE family N-acetylglucosaminyl deacetylase|nr:PIG-L family deacetylase [Acidimicrobiia bacterium]MBA3983934.1 PIG-L family deacetylase [Acidimicrobiia bacterium]MDQ3390185.1 PIG-L family deacetylase [Actinomycetota bacterium]